MSRLLKSLFTFSVPLLLGFVLATAVFTQGQETAPRTYYESLDLSSPESAVRAFVDAFHAQDYPTVFLILSSEAQSAWVRALNGSGGLDDGPVVNIDSYREHEEAYLAVIPGSLEEMEQTDYSYRSFDAWMLVAAEYDGFPIDLRGAVGIQSIEQSQTLEGAPAIDVVTLVDNISGYVIFRTVQSVSGRWRVLQVIVPDGKEKYIPWSVPVK